MSQPTHNPFVDLAVRSIRCFGNPTDEPTIRLLIDTWYHRGQLTADEVEQVAAILVEAAGCRTLCGRCGQPIERIADRTGDYWAHLEVPDPPHPATATPTFGEEVA